MREVLLSLGLLIFCTCATCQDVAEKKHNFKIGFTKAYYSSKGLMGEVVKPMNIKKIPDAINHFSISYYGSILIDNKDHYVDDRGYYWLGYGDLKNVMFAPSLAYIQPIGNKFEASLMYGIYVEWAWYKEQIPYYSHYNPIKKHSRGDLGQLLSMHLDYKITDRLGVFTRLQFGLFAHKRGGAMKNNRTESFGFGISFN